MNNMNNSTEYSFHQNLSADSSLLQLHNNSIEEKGNYFHGIIYPSIYPSEEIGQLPASWTLINRQFNFYWDIKYIIQQNKNEYNNFIFLQHYTFKPEYQNNW